MNKGGRPKGYPKTGGRQKGTRNAVSLEAKAAATRIVDDPAYLHTLTRRALAGTLPPAIETMLWHYAKGKPVEHLEVQGVIGLDVQRAAVEAETDLLSTEQLAAIVQKFDDIAAIKRGETLPLRVPPGRILPA